MLRGLYTAAAGMMAQQQRHDTVTNNIANLNTPGFKSSNALNRSFPDMLISAAGGENTRSGKIGTLSTGVFAEENMLSMGQGDLLQTNRSQDMALVSDITNFDPNGAAISFQDSGRHMDPLTKNVIYKPEGFFTVGPANNKRYTRDGSFHTDENGVLLTSNNLPVLGSDNRPVNVKYQQAQPPTGTVNVSWEDIQVAADGSLSTRSGEALVGAPRIQLTVVSNPNDLIREGDGVFRYTGDLATGIRQSNARDNLEVHQGYLERSNVDASQSAIDIMSALRAYEANQKVIQFYDRSLDKAVNEVGRV